MTDATRERRAGPVVVPDLALCAGALLLLVVVVAAGLAAPVRAVVACAVVLVVPGYAVMAAAFAPRLPERAVGAVLACGLSIAVAALGCVVLDGLGVRLQTGVLVGWTAAVGAGAAAAAAWRRRGHPAPALVARPSSRDVVLHIAGAVALVGMVALLVGVARDTRPVRDVPAGQVALYAVPQSPRRLVVGLDGRNAPAGSYRVVVRSGGPGRAAVRSFQVQLAAGATWRRQVVVSPGATTQVLLYRDGARDTPIRRLDLRAPGA